MAEQIYSNEKSIAEVLREMKSETLDFISTRFELLSAELKGKVTAWKKSLPMLVAGMVFGMGTFATFTFTLVSLVCAGIRSALPDGSVAVFAWPIAAIVICALYACIAAAVINAAVKRLKAQSLVPERTMRVLKQDQQWLQNEASDIKRQRVA